LTVPSGVQFIVLAAADSRHMLRMSPDIGEVTLSSAKSATGRAILPYVSRERQIAILGRAPTRAEATEFAATRARGYSISIDDVMRGATNLGAPVFDHRGEPMGAIVVSGPSNRVTADRHRSIGKLLVRHARVLSHRLPAPLAD
jgi:IclR family acetate operon transcriptional repressor